MSQKTDAELTTEADIIGNETVAGSNTADRVRDMLIDIIDSKPNNIEALLVANNFSDLNNANTARTNLGLGSAATQNTSAFDPSGVAATVQTNLNIHTSDTANPHATTKSQVGLSNADNTSDANKPVSTAQQTAIDAKVADSITDGVTTTAPSQNAVFDALALKIAAASNLSDVASAATSRTNLGATTVGANIFTATNPSAIRFLRVNANNTIDLLDAAAFTLAIGAQSSNEPAGSKIFSYQNFI